MKVCKYCGAENPYSTSKCSLCGAIEFKYKCGNCGTVFEEGMYCPKCGVKAETKAKKCPRCGVEFYSAACPDCGFTYNGNGTTVLYTDASAQPVKKRKTWLLVLGWIFIFPVPLTILMVRNQKQNKWVRIGIIAAAWLVYLIIALSGGAVEDKTAANEVRNATTDNTSVSTPSNSPEDNQYISQDNVTKEDTIEAIIESYNASSPNKLVFFEDFVAADKESKHYRTEFRLNAYSEALAKSYLIGEQMVDIIAIQDIYGNIAVRIYTDDATLDQCAEIIRFSSPMLDPTLDDAAIQETVDYIVEKKEANGYYYGELGLLLIGNEKDGYDLMIKTE